jgi:hypothetical protein
MRRRGVLLLAPLALAACFHSYGKHNEMTSQTVPGTKFRSLSVISGTDDQSDLRITLQVRQRLAAQGYAIVQRPGTWGTESEALRAICGAAPADSTGAPPTPVDGVVVVAWNEVSLHDCESSHMVYQNQGGYGGIDQMFQGLLKYLHGQSGARAGGRG